MGVVRIVHVEPPRPAGAKEEASDEHDHVVVARLREDLSMPGIVQQVAHLHERNRQQDSVEELEPERLEYEQQSEGEDKQPDGDHRLHGIENVLTVEDAFLLEASLQFNVAKVCRNRRAPVPHSVRIAWTAKAR